MDMEHTEAARDSRREANAANARRIGQKLNTPGSRLTKDERATAALIVKEVADLIATKPATERDREYFWTSFDIAVDVKLNAWLGTSWIRDEPGGAL